MFNILNYYSLSLFLGGVIALIAGLFVFFNDTRKRESVAWLLLNVSSAVWSFGYYSMTVASDRSVALASDLVLHAGAIFIPFFYFLFIISITGVYEKYKKVVYALVPIVIVLEIFNFSKHFVTDVYQKGPFYFAPNAGPLYAYFTLYFFAVVIAALVILLIQIKKANASDKQADKEDATRWRFIFISSAAGFIGGGSVFLLTFNIFIPPFPVALFAFYPILIAYVMLRYRLFNVKGIATELLTATLWVIFLFRTVLADNVEDRVISGVVLILTIIFGILLIRNIYHEVEQREKIESLAKDLEKSNADLGTANDRLKELDQVKSEFLSLATHQLRAPITAIKGYASLVAEGDFGKITPQLREAVDIIQQSSNSMAVMVDDFLNISRIEQGRMKYDYVVADAAVLAQEVVNELRPAVEKKGLDFSITFDKAQKYDTRMDLGKMKQAITNLIDNAMKYTPKGWIRVNIARQAPKILIEISDSGIGISAENIPKLFAKFSRAKNGVQTNVTGTGLGLFVVKQMVEAQGGRVWVTSAGEGRGSVFHIELAAFA